MLVAGRPVAASGNRQSSSSWVALLRFARRPPYGAHTIKLLDGKKCAFASFDTWSAAEKAIAELGAMQESKIFIGGLEQTVTAEDVSSLCQQFGTITHSKIFTKNDKSRLCAFVTCSSSTEAEVCINALSGKGLVANMARQSKVGSVCIGLGLGEAYHTNYRTIAST